jgi:hypothetical protein
MILEHPIGLIPIFAGVVIGIILRVLWVSRPQGPEHFEMKRTTGKSN